MRSYFPVLAAALVGVVASGCTYGSAMEAEAACREWWVKAIIVTYVTNSNGQTEPIEGYARRCQYEQKTHQWLGLEIDGWKQGETRKRYEWEKISDPRPYKVVKYFRYPSR